MFNILFSFDCEITLESKKWNDCHVSRATLV